MKKMNKKFIVLTLATFIMITGTSVYASGTISSLFTDISFSEHQEEAKKVEDLLNQSWSKGRELLTNNEGTTAFANIGGDQDLTKWTFIDITKLQEELLSSFSQEEQSSFLDAFYSKERIANLDVGDYMSALLVSPNKSEALAYWEKSNGSYVVLEMKTKNNDSTSWYVNGVKIESST